jgi:ankyrin repeat protein
MGAACAMTLLQAGADVNLTNEAGHMPIHLSANNNRAQSINILLSHGASVNHEGGCGYSAFQLACSKGHEKAFDAMWSAQPDIHAPRKNDGNSPLHFASSSARVGMVEKLLGAGANANAVNWKGETPLFAVAENATSSQDKSKQENFLLVAAKLLDSGCCSDARNDTGQTVLHRAAHHGNGDLIALMASRGADIHANNNAGVSIQSVARRKGHVKLVEEIEALQSSRRASAAIDRILMDQDRSLSPGAAP